MKIPQLVDVCQHKRRVWKQDPQADQPTLFGDAPPALEASDEEIAAAAEEGRKRDGKARAAANHRELLELARKVAIQAALRHPDRLCTAADVAEVLKAKHIQLGNWMGSLFNSRSWVDTGQRVRSRVPSAHAREIRVWRLLEGESGGGES